MNKFYTTLVALAAIAVAMPAGADHCTTYNTSAPEVDTTLVGGTNYVDNDVCQPECVVSTWVYEETNGIAGLQRGDETVDDTCHGLIESDTIVF